MMGLVFAAAVLFIFIFNLLYIFLSMFYFHTFISTGIDLFPKQMQNWVRTLSLEIN